MPTACQLVSAELTGLWMVAVTSLDTGRACIEREHHMPSYENLVSCFFVNCIFWPLERREGTFSCKETKIFYLLHIKLMKMITLPHDLKLHASAHGRRTFSVAEKWPCEEPPTSIRVNPFKVVKQPLTLPNG
jgi:hypothetical protein